MLSIVLYGPKNIYFPSLGKCNGLRTYNTYVQYILHIYVSDTTLSLIHTLTIISLQSTYFLLL